jgi:hypothetical protein
MESGRSVERQAARMRRDSFRAPVSIILSGPAAPGAFSGTKLSVCRRARSIRAPRTDFTPGPINSPINGPLGQWFRRKWRRWKWPKQNTHRKGPGLLERGPETKRQNEAGVGREEEVANNATSKVALRGERSAPQHRSLTPGGLTGVDTEDAVKRDEGASHRRGSKKEREDRQSGQPKSVNQREKASP